MLEETTENYKEIGLVPGKLLASHSTGYDDWARNTSALLFRTLSIAVPVLTVFLEI